MTPNDQGDETPGDCLESDDLPGLESDRPTTSPRSESSPPAESPMVESGIPTLRELDEGLANAKAEAAAEAQGYQWTDAELDEWFTGVGGDAGIASRLESDPPASGADLDFGLAAYANQRDWSTEGILNRWRYRHGQEPRTLESLEMAPGHRHGAARAAVPARQP